MAKKEYADVKVEALDTETVTRIKPSYKGESNLKKSGIKKGAKLPSFPSPKRDLLEKQGKSKEPKKKNVVKRHKLTISDKKGYEKEIPLPSTVESDLKGGALDEFIAPKVKALKETGEKALQSAKKGIKKVKGQIRSYHNNSYKEGE